MKVSLRLVPPGVSVVDGATVPNVVSEVEPLVVDVELDVDEVEEVVVVELVVVVPKCDEVVVGAPVFVAPPQASKTKSSAITVPRKPEMRRR
jgi:hypothetical protein